MKRILSFLLCFVFLAPAIMAKEPVAKEYGFGDSVEEFIREVDTPKAQDETRPYDVFLILGPHAHKNTASVDGRRYAEEALKLVEAELAVIGKAPFALWLEQGIPMDLPTDIVQLETLFALYGQQAGLSAAHTAGKFFSHRLGYTEKKFAGLLSHLDQELKSIYVAAGRKQLQNIKLINARSSGTLMTTGYYQRLVDWFYQKKTAGSDVRILWELAPFEAWVEKLMDSFFASGMTQELRDGRIEQAAILMHHTSLSQERGIQLRDEAMAKGIAIALREEPDRAIFVVRGAAHGGFERILVDRGIKVKAVSSQMHSALLESYNLGRKSLGDADENESTRLSPQSRDFSLREIIRTLLMVHFVESGRSTGPEAVEDITVAVGGLSAFDVDRWSKDVGSIAGLDPSIRGEKTLTWLRENGRPIPTPAK